MGWKKLNDNSLTKDKGIYSDVFRKKYDGKISKEQHSGAGIGIITGKVEDSKTGKIIAGATILTNSGIWVKSLPDGYYFLRIPAGTYKITVKADGYQTNSKDNILTTSGKTIELNFSMEPTDTINSPLRNFFKKLKEDTK
ncbi:MAG: carboxypeptidase-like regulatory domain-containing protein [Thermodesulfobacteriota bacterium]|nr:carboxypeptidase-like regulatory domain-containing protein [Thermodesulfobacteriota bacterium]